MHFHIRIHHVYQTFFRIKISAPITKAAIITDEEGILVAKFEDKDLKDKIQETHCSLTSFGLQQVCFRFSNQFLKSLIKIFLAHEIKTMLRFEEKSRKFPEFPCETNVENISFHRKSPDLTD